MSLNQTYLTWLNQYPLLTKSVTAGVLAAVNELVATAVSGEYHRTKFEVLGKKYEIKHVFSKKTLLMVVYGAFVATPLSHQLYKIINRVFQGKLGPLMKALQILTSLCTVTPTLSAAFVLWLSVINGYKITSSDTIKEFVKVKQVISQGLRQNFWLVYRSSAQTSAVALMVAQTFLPTELWVVFFTFVFFVLGTAQNTRFKLGQRAQRLQQEKLAKLAKVKQEDVVAK